MHSVFYVEHFVKMPFPPENAIKCKNSLRCGENPPDKKKKFFDPSKTV